MKNVLVTGASGFLGSHLVKGLWKKNLNVVQMTHEPLPVSNGVGGSVCDLPLLKRIVTKYEVDTVFHLAAQAQVSTAVANPVETLKTNVQGTWNVLEACRLHGVRRVVVASSDKAYGAGEVPYSESQPLLSHGIYATSKAMADFVAQAYAKDYPEITISITRCSNLYGPGHENYSTLIPGTIRSILRKERPVIRSDGQAARDYLFVEDAVNAYITLAESNQCGAWNFGSGRAYTAIEVANHILKLMKSKLKVEILGTAKDEIQVQYSDCSRAEFDLAWMPKYSLKTGLEKTITWYKDHLK